VRVKNTDETYSELEFEKYLQGTEKEKEGLSTVSKVMKKIPALFFRRRRRIFKLIQTGFGRQQIELSPSSLFVGWDTEHPPDSK
jgi:hypothetical protein